jgi:hypothetical protein
VGRSVSTAFGERRRGSSATSWGRDSRAGGLGDGGVMRHRDVLILAALRVSSCSRTTISACTLPCLAPEPLSKCYHHPWTLELYWLRDHTSSCIDAERFNSPGIGELRPILFHAALVLELLCASWVLDHGLLLVPVYRYDLSARC